MEINNNLPSSMIQTNSDNGIGKTFPHTNKFGFHGNNFCNDVGAYSMASQMAGRVLNFDSAMSNLASFKDMICTAQDTMSLMQVQSQDIYSLIQRAHSEDCGKDELGLINSEIASKISEINRLYHGAEFDGVNPFGGKFGLNIPNWQNLIRKPSESESASAVEESNPESEITDLITSISFDFDMSANVDGASMNMSASATINIGFTEDGALQITVDASLDYDLSGISTSGADSQNALDIITNFLSLLSGKQNDLNFASNFIDGFCEKATLTMGDWSSYFPEISGSDLGDASSSHIQGQIVQQAAITLDCSANQIPNIAINLL